MTINKFGFDVVSGCQLRCVGCPNSVLKQPIEKMSVSDFIKCMRNIDAKINLFRLFNFGEPLLHPNLIEILENIKRSDGFPKIEKIEISTNAQYLDNEMIECIFKNNLVNNFVVSCDGNGTKEEYEMLRPPAKWDKLMLFLESLSHNKKRYASNIQLITRTIEQEEDGKKRWIDILKPMGFNSLFRGWGVLPNTKNEFFKGEFVLPSGLCRYFSSFIGGGSAYCNCHGDVVPCCRHPMAFKIGNLNKHKYADILKNKLVMTMKDRMVKSRKEIPICNECDS